MKITLAAIALCLVFAFTVSAWPNKGGANADQPEVEAVLAEIREVMRQHYNFPINRKKPTQESLEKADLEDNIRYSLPQAQSMLYKMKKQWGFEITAEEESRIIPDSQYWWKSPITWAFNGDHTTEEEDIIRKGFELWMQNTCLIFNEKTVDQLGANEDHIRVIKGSGCWSYVGHTDKPLQELSIGDGCLRIATIAHEIGHAMGLSHEQARPDRDDHVDIIWENIVENKEHNFIMKDDIDPSGTQYDVSSTMQYHSLGFSIDSSAGLRTIMPKDVYQLPGMGQRARLQFNDIKRINYVYCPAVCNPDDLAVTNKTCQHGGYQDPKDCTKCRCPTGTTGDCMEPEASSWDTPSRQVCGGAVDIADCSITALTIPSYPQPYGEDQQCAWHLTNTNGNGFIFAFEEQPDMPCSSADVCYDYVEIRTNSEDWSIPGKFFCKCGENKGRVVVADQENVMVRFASTTNSERGGAGTNTGFVLNVHSPCNSTIASTTYDSCIITQSGYDSCSGVSLPLCDFNNATFYQPPTKARNGN